MSNYPVINNVMGHLERDESADFGEHNLESCSICRELKHEKNIMCGSERFVAFPDIGQIVEGYVQVVTRWHKLQEELTSVGQIPSEWIPELQKFIVAMQEGVESIYGPSIIFEHGEVPTYRKDGRIRTVHMHMHIIPTNQSLLDQITNSNIFTVKPIDDLTPLREKSASGEPYYFYQDLNRQNYLLEFGEELPSQILRKLVSGLPKVTERNQHWLKENQSEVQLNNCWECMAFRPADRFYATVRKLRQEYLNRNTNTTQAEVK